MPDPTTLVALDSLLVAHAEGEMTRLTADLLVRPSWREARRRRHPDRTPELTVGVHWWDDLVARIDPVDGSANSVEEPATLAERLALNSWATEDAVADVQRIGATRERLNRERTLAPTPADRDALDAQLDALARRERGQLRLVEELKVVHAVLDADQATANAALSAA